MLRLRIAGVLVILALLAAGCGDDGGEAAPADDPQEQAEASAPQDGEPDNSSAADGTEASSISAESDGEAAVVADNPADAAPVGADALLASAAVALDGRSVRGEVTLEVEPGFELSSSFASDADGDLSVSIELPPGTDPEFPDGADAETRHMGGAIYVRPVVSAETLAELGVEEAWYVAEPVVGGDPMSGAIGSAGGLLCLLPQMLGAVEDCGLLSGMSAYLEAADEAEIVGREDVRGIETTRVRFLISLLDLAGDVLGLGEGDGDGASDTGVFDDAASDPFAEGLGLILGFLDSDFEVEAWVDDESLLRRLALDLNSMFAGLAGPEADDAMPPSPFTVEFYDFDADISVDAPPPDAILDVGLIVGDDDYAYGETYESYEDDGYDDDYDDDRYDDDYEDDAYDDDGYDDDHDDG